MAGGCRRLAGCWCVVCVVCINLKVDTGDRWSERAAGIYIRNMRAGAGSDWGVAA